MSATTTDKISQAALASLLTLATGAGLSGCSSHEQPVRCQGVAKGNAQQPLLMSKGQCEKIAKGQVVAATAADKAAYKPEPYNSYIECYGIAAANKNDCGTKSTACAGSVHVDSQADAWIALPQKICQQVGGRVVQPKAKNQWQTHPSRHFAKTGRKDNADKEVL